MCQAAVIVAARIVVVVVIRGQPVPVGEDPRDGGFAGPLPAADLQNLTERAERVPHHGGESRPARDQGQVLFSRVRAG